MRLINIYLLIFSASYYFSTSFAQVAPPDELPEFLDLPYKDSAVVIEQGWYYDENIDPFRCVHPRGLDVSPITKHCGVDYFKRDDVGNAIKFDVYAAAGGTAKYLPAGPSGFATGNTIAIRHELKYDGTALCTRYLHLESPTEELAQKFPVGRDVAVEKGEWIGVAGVTGLEDIISNPADRKIHLHFEVGLADGGNNCTSAGRTYYDPYDIADTLLTGNPPRRPIADFYPRNRTGRADQYSGCGDGQLFADADACPVASKFNALNVDEIPELFGAPIDLQLGTGRKLMSSEQKGNNTLELRAGYGIVLSIFPAYTYYIGYYFDVESQRWQRFEFPREDVNSPWIAGEATHQLSIQGSGIDLTEQNYFLSYMCVYDESRWKCGCRDDACRQSKWQIQQFSTRLE